MSALLGVDLGGTSLRAAWASAEFADAACSPVALADEPAPGSVAELVERVALHASRVEGSPIAGVGITIPGLVDGTRCRWVPNLPFLDGVDLASALAPALAPFAGPSPSPAAPAAVPVVVANDAHLALLAEVTHGAARGTRDALLLAVGTGIGSAVLCEGRIARGAHGGAVSFGWASADVADVAHPRLGWLERHASGAALDELGAKLPQTRDGRGLIDAARRGDVAARDALAGVAGALATTVASAVALLDPEVVLLAGGVAAAVDVLGPLVSEGIDARVPAHLRGVPVRAGAFGPRAGIVGALVAARSGAVWWEVRG